MDGWIDLIASDGWIESIASDGWIGSIASDGWIGSGESESVGYGGFGGSGIWIVYRRWSDDVKYGGTVLEHRCWIYAQQISVGLVLAGFGGDLTV